MTDPSPDQTLDLLAELARIDAKQVELQQISWGTLRILKSTTLASPSLLFYGAIAMAALVIEGAVIAKLCL